MPLSYKIDSDKDIELAVWSTVEPADYFQNKLIIHPSEKSIIEELSSRKKLEWYSSRYLLHIMSGRTVRGEFTKDVHGKPHLENSRYHISISHSGDLVAVMASETLVGVDIQFFVPKIHRIQHKFVNEGELNNISENQYLEALHIIWGAKESLYKAYGKKALSFRKHITVSDLELTGNTGQFQGLVQKDDYRKAFKIHYFIINNHILVYAKEDS